ncbi:MAG: hypothetical protein FD189_768 [Elusimicrobia bacterium]|nr:MAG: hypothetical protein FD154_699 [Elusimicrobiota bacterium]KAF0157014.1 MAG: hypothetical protein FD189_768 [Elusimicrobiota bacterium]
MEKEKAVKCVPLDLVRNLQTLSRRLWDEKNPAAVHVSALIEEFGDEVTSMEKVLGEYEAGYAGRLAIAEREHAEKAAVLEAQISDLKDRVAAGDAERAGLHGRIAQLSDELRKKESALADARAAGAENESGLNSRYVARMKELYDKLNRKELEMLSSWEEKNGELERRDGALRELEADIEKRLAAGKKALAGRESALEDEFALKKAELIKTFERARAELQAREKSLAGREAATPDAGRK